MRLVVGSVVLGKRAGRGALKLLERPARFEGRLCHAGRACLAAFCLDLGKPAGDAADECETGILLGYGDHDDQGRPYLVFSLSGCALQPVLVRNDQLAPFQLEQLGHGSGVMGASGVLLSLGTLLGAMANRKLLQKGWEPERLVFVSCVLATAGGLLVALLGSSFMFIVPVAMVAFAFALAIPNILAPALKDYSDRLRTAGAIFGTKYYLLLGAGLWLSGLAQNLGAVLLASGLGALTIAMLKPKSRAARQTGDTATRKPVRLYRELFR